MVPYDLLPPLARTIVERVLSVARGDPRIVGVTVGGSAATGEMDAFSDLDLVVVCRDGSSVLPEARTLAASAGPLLAAFTGEHVGEPRLLICLYGPPLLHVDIKVVELAELAGRVEDGVVLFERDGGGMRETRAAAPAVWPAADPQWIEDRFWVWVHYCATKIGRGELFECLDGLALMRSAALAPLASLARGARAQGVRRIETVAPDLVPALAATVGDHSRAGCVAALGAAIDLYRSLRPATVEVRAAAEREAVAYVRGL